MCFVKILSYELHSVYCMRVTCVLVHFTVILLAVVIRACNVYRMQNVRVVWCTFMVDCFACWVVWHNVHSQQHTHVSSSYRSSRLGLSHWDPYAMRRGGCLELYYCNMVEWSWWDSSFIWKTNWFPSVLWHCWFGHMTCKKSSPKWPIMCRVGRWASTLHFSLCMCCMCLNFNTGTFGVGLELYVILMSDMQFFFRPAAHLN